MVHCPDCGAITRKVRDEDGDEVLVCTNDDCPRIIVQVISRPTDHGAALMDATLEALDEGPTGVAAFYSARFA